MTTINIHIIDSIESRINAEDAQLIKETLAYDHVYWIQGQFSKKKKVTKNYFFNHKGKLFWRFYTGLIPKIKEFCDDQNIKVEISGEQLRLEQECEPNLPGIVFRKDQLYLIKRAIEEQRGIVKAATGSGKTLLQLGIISAFPSSKVLLLAHTVTITAQTYGELKKYGFENDITILGGGNKTFDLSKRILVSTVQSFLKQDLVALSAEFEIIIIDEAHHVVKADGNYGKVLSNLLSPIRLGFTATLPDSVDKKLALEGLLGIVVGELSIQEAVEKNILATPKIKLIKSEPIHTLSNLRKYADVYNAGIVNNKSRNHRILVETKKYNEQGKSVLIMVTQIAHGDNLMLMARKEFGLDLPFVQGSVPSDEREKIKQNLISKKIMAVIASVVWCEGVDIPTLDCLINAGSGKSEIKVLQSVGRSLRRAVGKEEAVIVDFFDPSHKFFVEHFGHRVTLYMNNGWL